MIRSIRSRQLMLLGGDVLMLYLALFLTLFIRYGEITDEVKKLHLGPFSVLFIFWVLIFYIVGFYELDELKNNQEFGKRFALSILINFVIAITFFYFIPAFGITPKTNLFIFLALFGSAAYAWRTTYNNFLNARTARKKILLVGYNEVARELAEHLDKNSHLGYEIKFWMKEGLQDKEFNHLSQIILANKIDLIVVPAHIKKSSRAARLIYRNLTLGIEVADLAAMYATIFKKVPISELEEVWFLENLATQRKIYDAIKQPVEKIIALMLMLIFMPLAILIIAATKLTSRGSAFFTQVRVGQNERHFVLWKFRTMVQDAEKHGPQWARPSDKRTTPFGKILRRSHLDELPQLWNILRGELSLIGPRPERPEFVKSLEKEIPYYDLRHLVRPGLTGWAQINYRYGSSLDDAYEKLQYDIYYLKHRSFLMDMGIFLKTAKRFFIPAK